MIDDVENKLVKNGDIEYINDKDGNILMEKGLRYAGRGVTLYGNGEAVAVSHNPGTGSRSMYLGKDTLGSVRSVTADTGTLEDRYEYDAFGRPYEGDLNGGMDIGYTGKPYDTTTGLYDYGYRDYKPQAARFTTIDPIRDGNNWFAYVNNDTVNWLDMWGLDSMYSIYIPEAQKIVSTYVPTNPDGSVDLRNVKTYSFDATNNVTTKPQKTMPQTGTPEYYYPQSFPSGIWDIGQSRLVPDTDPLKDFKGNIFIPTKATQTVNTYGLTLPANGAQPTGIQVDTGYGLHYSASAVTAGCIIIETQEQTNKFAALSDNALSSENGRSTIIIPGNKGLVGEKAD